MWLLVRVLTDESRCACDCVHLRRSASVCAAAMRLSLESLDNKRLGKQRVESYQIWRVITGVRA